jgi:rRNA processing protein Gar1
MFGKNHELGEKATGASWALANDGDSTYWLAKHWICMAKKLEVSSPLGHLLSSLLGFNCWTSEDGVTYTGDPKHIFKRFSTLLCNVSSFMVKDINIRPSDIVEQLTLLPNMTFEKACQLLDPSDKQNVPKAVSLLQSLLQIKQLPKSPDPTINRHRDAIAFVAEIFGYFLRPFITVDMSLSDQVCCLATYSYLAAAMQINHGSACITGA